MVIGFEVGGNVGSDMIIGVGEEEEDEGIKLKRVVEEIVSNGNALGFALTVLEGSKLIRVVEEIKLGLVKVDEDETELKLVVVVLKRAVRILLVDEVNGIFVGNSFEADPVVGALLSSKRSDTSICGGLNVGAFNDASSVLIFSPLGSHAF